ncbi:HpcH/HpaI aldolase family protein [Candidatus Leptofilum sp.]|uniref:HpcH/HpaI aldolase family protein n=1 Tax=Candidatus Leptofilum sp. TaxID=3241576 RepID=UPI003B59ECEC
MRPNRLRVLLAEGKTAVNGWLHIPSSWSAEVMAHAGWDSVTIDLQHGLTDYETAVTMLQAIATTDTVPLARSTWNDPAQIMRLLDAGAYGIICPMINTRAEAEAFVGACRYPPMGYRSLGPTRARVYAGADYAQHANETLLTLAMIETQEALNNLSEILATPGLDGIFVGPGDLGLSLTGQMGMDMSDPTLAAALAQIAEVTRANGRIAGIWVPTAARGQQMQQLGYQFITVSADSRLLNAATQEIIQEMKSQ